VYPENVGDDLVTEESCPIEEDFLSHDTVTVSATREPLIMCMYKSKGKGEVIPVL
jgi:hypothetical protein